MRIVQVVDLLVFPAPSMFQLPKSFNAPRSKVVLARQLGITPDCSAKTQVETWKSRRVSISSNQHGEFASRRADNMMQLGKESTLSSARCAATFVREDDVLHKLFTKLAYRYKDRACRYSRLLRTRIRVGDVAPMAYIEFIDQENELRQSKPPTPQPPQRAPFDPWTKSNLSSQFALPNEEKTSSGEDTP